MSGQSAYEASVGFTTPWDQLPADYQKTWETWASRGEASTFKAVLPETYACEFQALVAAGYQLGSNMVLIIKDVPTDWGGPEIPTGQMMPVTLDSAFHQYQAPDYTNPHGFKVTLSFDQLYECTIPWTSILQVIFRGPDPTTKAESA